LLQLECVLVCLRLYLPVAYHYEDTYIFNQARSWG
jgi:hypothetical protein